MRYYYLTSRPEFDPFFDGITGGVATEIPLAGPIIEPNHGIDSGEYMPDEFRNMISNARSRHPESKIGVLALGEEAYKKLAPEIGRAIPISDIMAGATTVRDESKTDDPLTDKSITIFRTTRNTTGNILLRWTDGFSREVQFRSNLTPANWLDDAYAGLIEFRKICPSRNAEMQVCVRDGVWLNTARHGKKSFCAFQNCTREQLAKFSDELVEIITNRCRVYS